MSIASDCEVNQTASASSSGSVTATFTWTPTNNDPVADPPPKKVMVKESAEAKWTWNDFPANPRRLFGSGVSNATSIGDIPDNNPFPVLATSGGKRGTRIKAYDSSSGTVAVSCSLSASSSFHSSSTVRGYASVSVAYTASLIAGVEILRAAGGSTNYESITDANNKCLPGEAINLKVAGADSGPYQWAEPDNLPFKNYDEMATGRHQLVKLVAADRTADTFSFHYTRRWIEA